MSNLSRDVIEKILLGLPAFDLVRCKCVCKVWRSLISSADFVAAHLQRSKSDPSSHHLLVRSRSFDLRSRPTAGPFSSLICFSSADLFIVGSVNGLICIAGKGDIPYLAPSPDDIWIWNPVTGLSNKLPYSSNGFYDGQQNIKFAFWCDDGVYKVVKFLSNPIGVISLLLWVSTSPDAWTEISTVEFGFHCHPRQFHACDVLIEGLAAYWIVVYCDGDNDYDSDDDDYNSDDDDGDDDEVTVVSLDFKSLALTNFEPLSNQQLQMPKNYLLNAHDGDPNSVLFGGKLNGEFVLVVYNIPADTECYDVWTPAVMDDDGDPGWIKKFTVCLDYFPFDKCLGIVNDKLVLTSCSYKELALFDPLSEMLEVLETDSKLQTISEDYACGFVGSLVSIDGFGFESNDLLSKNMCISWPYSLYPS